jgi:acyl-CoA synthetase (AMP-forming)/AMP-acid ligase II
MCNLYSLLYESTQKYSEKIYVVDKEKEWTYSDIFKKTYTIAEQLKLYGVDSGDRVLVYLDNSVEYIAAFFSIILANGIVVPINKNTTIDNLKYIIEETSPKVLISNKLFISRLQGKIETDGFNLVDVDNVFEFDTFRNTNLINYLTHEVELPSIILYTSGTTRMPKGVTLTHKNLITNTESILKYLELTDKDSILATINFSYSYGNSLLLTHTKVGGRIIIENRVSFPLKVLEQMLLSKATGFSTVGSYINLLLKQDCLKDYYLQSLRYITFAGESTSFEDIVKLSKLAPHLRIFIASETGGARPGPVPSGSKHGT